MEANALQEIDLTVDALRDGHAPLSDAELDFQIAKAGYENRVKNSTSVKPAVSGEFPDLTLNPSILIGHPSKNSNGGCEGWHGYLTDGVLVACE